jgi:hypothetical protein
MSNKKLEIGLCNYTTSDNGESLCVSGYLAECCKCNKYDYNLTVYIQSPTCSQLHNLANTYCPNNTCCEFMGNTQTCVFCNKNKVLNTQSTWNVCEKCVKPLIARNKEFLVSEWALRDNSK